MGKTKLEIDYSPLRCEYCGTVDICRYQWLDDEGIPHVFCHVRHLEGYERDLERRTLERERSAAAPVT